MALTSKQRMAAISAVDRAEAGLGILRNKIARRLTHDGTVDAAEHFSLIIDILAKGRAALGVEPEDPRPTREEFIQTIHSQLPEAPCRVKDRGVVVTVKSKEEADLVETLAVDVSLQPHVGHAGISNYVGVFGFPRRAKK